MHQMFRIAILLYRLPHHHCNLRICSSTNTIFSDNAIIIAPYDCNIQSARCDVIVHRSIILVTRRQMASNCCIASGLEGKMYRSDEIIGQFTTRDDDDDEDDDAAVEVLSPTKSILSDLLPMDVKSRICARRSISLFMVSYEARISIRRNSRAEEFMLPSSLPPPVDAAVIAAVAVAVGPAVGDISNSDRSRSMVRYSSCNAERFVSSAAELFDTVDDDEDVDFLSCAAAATAAVDVDTERINLSRRVDISLSLVLITG